MPENVRLLEAVLAARGYDVVSATDGPAALDLVESADPDLVLLDVVMPQMDGYAVAELTPRWKKRGYDLSFGAGIAAGGTPPAARSGSRAAPTTPRSERLRTSRPVSRTRRPRGRS